MLHDTPRMHRPGSELVADFVDGLEPNERPADTTVLHAVAASDSLSDIFGSAPSSPGSHAAAVPPIESLSALDDRSDIPRLRSIHVTSGYRDGIALSKETHLQSGFDEGYGLGAELALVAGRCIGVLQGLASAAAAFNQDAHLAPRHAQELCELARCARAELSVAALLDPKFFSPDGIWLYDVPDPDALKGPVLHPDSQNLPKSVAVAKGAINGESAASTGDPESRIMFSHVAAAHPVLRRWIERMTEAADKLNIDLLAS